MVGYAALSTCGPKVAHLLVDGSGNGDAVPRLGHDAHRPIQHERQKMLAIPPVPSTIFLTILSSSLVISGSRGWPFSNGWALMAPILSYMTSLSAANEGATLGPRRVRADSSALTGLFLVWWGVALPSNYPACLVPWRLSETEPASESESDMSG